MRFEAGGIFRFEGRWNLKKTSGTVSHQLRGLASKSSIVLLAIGWFIETMVTPWKINLEHNNGSPPEV